MTIETDPTWSYPPELDALSAAPEHHTLLVENERVRGLETHIPTGEPTALHTPYWSSVYDLFSWSDFVRRDERGKVLLDERLVKSLNNPPAAMWSEPQPLHTLENVGVQELRLISVELKDPLA